MCGCSVCTDCTNTVRLGAAGLQRVCASCEGDLTQLPCLQTALNQLAARMDELMGEGKSLSCGASVDEVTQALPLLTKSLASLMRDKGRDAVAAKASELAFQRAEFATLPARERALREEGRPQAYVALECDDAVLTMLKAQKERCNELERELARERALRTELEAASEQRSLAHAAAELQFAQCRESDKTTATSLHTESDFLRWGSPCVSSTASSIWTGASGSREAQVARETEFTNILEASQATPLRMSDAIQSRQKRSDELMAEHAAQAERAAQADRASHAEFTVGAEETGDVPTSPQSGLSPPRPRRTPASSSSSKRGSGSSSTVNVPLPPYSRRGSRPGSRSGPRVVNLIDWEECNPKGCQT